MTRRFTLADQTAFAELSGDWNPIHVDPLFARRTAAGEPVVHGVHLLLHALDEVAQKGEASALPASISASFQRFVLLDEDVEVRTVALPNGGLGLQIVVDNRVRASITCAMAGDPPAALQPSSGAHFDPGRTPIDWVAEESTGPNGTLAIAHAAPAWAAAFPDAARWIGADSLAQLGTSTRLVGMVCPGLHSVFLELKAHLGSGRSDLVDHIAFEMGTARHNLIAGRIVAKDLTATVKCLNRTPPAAQRTVAELRTQVAPEAFDGCHALVVGGSRGLGEVTAKLLAAGGARVTLTFARGEADARAIADEIRAAGGSCDVLRYQVGQSAQDQLAAVAAPISHAYYFATPRIARANARFFSRDRMADFQSFFVDGFWNLASALKEHGDTARIFYPSTLYLENRPRGLAEYAMAKAAGEILCAEINATMAPLQVQVARLPQLATDQNMTSLGVAGAAPAEVLLPYLLAMHR